MPHKNTIRTYYAGGYYHIYNRGVEKRIIFTDSEDYKQFISLLEYYLITNKPQEPVLPVRNTPYWRSKLEENEVELISYCLMPNHFHFLLKQNSKDGVTKFMRRISNTYVGYFNKKYDRVGALFQGKFKTAHIKTDSYLLHLSRYIHINPLEVGPLKNKSGWLKSYPYSSYQDYLKIRRTPWVHPNIILGFFKNSTKYESSPKASYRYFVESSVEKSEDLLGKLILE